MIDFESVQPPSLAALAPDFFRAKIFVGATQTKLPFDVVTAIQQMGDRAEYIKISGVGRNALDFHIAYYIGRIAVQEPDAFFHIVSLDTGFDPLIHHLRDKNIFCGRWASLEEIPAVKSTQVKSPEERAILFLSRIFQDKATKPQTEKALRSAIGAHFQRQLTPDDVSSIVDALQRPGHVAIANGKVTYAAPLDTHNA
ncbi:PIN domain-containing protein [Ramlibacter sp.]|uniref:PIN domain-containing protein n=1 Tax=Ramlibacter sp. TaxID=1917967 RepID=UPI002ED18D95